MKSSNNNSYRVNSEATKERIYRGLLRKIILNELHQGQRVIEEALAKTYHVSRTPIREALFALEKDGIIERVHGCGARVATFTPDDVEQIYEVRRVLECCALSKAVSNLSFTRLLQLKHDLDEISGTTGTQCSHRQKEIDLQLHKMIVVSSGNRRLISYYENLSLMTDSLKLMSYRDEAHAKEIGAQHSAIIEALLRREAEEADKLLRHHIEDGCRNAIEVFFKQHHSRGNAVTAAKRGLW
jgi:DNA-binding GntR family transcriptional regulator